MGFKNQALGFRINVFTITKGEDIMKVIYRAICTIILLALLTACGGKATATEPAPFDAPADEKKIKSLLAEIEYPVESLTIL